MDQQSRVVEGGMRNSEQHFPVKRTDPCQDAAGGLIWINSLVWLKGECGTLNSISP